MGRTLSRTMFRFRNQLFNWCCIFLLAVVLLVIKYSLSTGETRLIFMNYFQQQISNNAISTQGGKLVVHSEATTAVMDSKHLQLLEYSPNDTMVEQNISASQFAIRGNLLLPMPKVTLPFQDLLKQEWVKDLQNILTEIPPHTRTSKSLVTIVTCDVKFKGMLLNWLVSALVNTHPPLSNVIILAIDKPLQQLMTKHGFNCLYMTPKDLMPSNMIHYVQTNSRTPQLPLVMIWRVTILRLLNHWGYDVANYDTDAIILKNTEQLYYGELSDSDFIGSRANFPASTSKVFGLTVCGGLFMIKSSVETEKYWNAVSHVQSVGTNSFDDQPRINDGLTMMDLKFNQTGLFEFKNWVGRNQNGFMVTILHFRLVCRWTCKQEERDSYYVWHFRHDLKVRADQLAFREIETLKSDGNWFLRDDWVQIAENSDAVGIEWLKKIKA